MCVHHFISRTRIFSLNCRWRWLLVPFSMLVLTITSRFGTLTQHSIEPPNNGDIDNRHEPKPQLKHTESVSINDFMRLYGFNFMVIIIYFYLGFSMPCECTKKLICTYLERVFRGFLLTIYTFQTISY